MAAFLIDAVFLIAVYVITFVVMFPIVVDDLTSNDDPSVIFANALTRLLFFTTVLVIVICGLLEGKWGRTPGKVVVKLKVVLDDDYNQTIGAKRGITRGMIKSITFLLVALPFFITPPAEVVLLLLSLVSIDHLWPLWDNQNQTLHDKVANSHVVSTRTRRHRSSPL